MPLVHELHNTRKKKEKITATGSCHRNIQAANACLQETSFYCFYFFNRFLRMANQNPIEQKGIDEFELEIKFYILKNTGF